MSIHSTSENSKVSHIWFLPVQASKGVFPSTAVVGLRFCKYTAVDSASAQKQCGRLESASMDRTASTSVLFTLSATPFCSGVLGTVSSCQTPSFFKHFSKSAETHSPPLSVRRVFSFLPVDLSTRENMGRLHPCVSGHISRCSGYCHQ